MLRTVIDHSDLPATVLGEIDREADAINEALTGARSKPVSAGEVVAAFRGVLPRALTLRSAPAAR